MNRQAKFDKLLEPFQMGKVHIKNRMIKTGAGMGYANEDEYYGEPMILWNISVYMWVIIIVGAILIIAIITMAIALGRKRRAER